MSLKGNLGTIALPELLQWLAIGQKTGTLVIVKDDGEHRVGVDRGRIISTSTSDEAMRLGSCLLEAGLLDGPTLERAQRLREATGMSLGRVLLTLQAVGEDELRGALRDKAEALISSLFHSENASFQFVEDGDLGDHGVSLSLDATQLVLSAAHHLEGPPSDESSSAAPKPAKLPLARRSRPVQATATLIETLPEHSAPRVEPTPPPAPRRALDRRRAMGGLAAAALLVTAVTAVLLIGRSQVPAKAEESADAATGAVLELAPLAAGDLAATRSDTVAAPTAPASPMPSGEVPPATGPDTGADAEEARLTELLALQEAELRDEYREELDELRRQLEAARLPEADLPAGELAAGVIATEPAGVEPGPVGNDAAETSTEGADFGPPSPSPSPSPPAPPTAMPPIAEPELPAKPDAAEVGAPVGGAVTSAPTEPPAPARTPARLIRRQTPTYPVAASRLGREARVTLRVLIDEDGRVAKIETAGAKAGMGFDDAARAAASRSRWRPATENGAPVASWVDLRFDFELP